jgi:uncharacterized protein (TIGR03083 family)
MAGGACHAGSGRRCGAVAHCRAVGIKELCLRTLEADGPALLAAARRDPQATVAACPEWTVDKLVGHMGRIHSWVTELVTTRAQERLSPRAFGEGPEGDPAARIEWAREKHAGLVEALRGVEEDEPVWGFVQGVGPARFWFARQALETSLHRWDAQAAGGDPEPVDADLGVLGVDEILGLFLPGMAESAAQVSTGASMHLHCIDRDGEWLLRFGADGTTLSHEHAKGDVAVRGSGSDLYLLLWNRIGHDRLQVFGDASLLDRWAQSVAI